MSKKMYYYTTTETMQKILQNGNMWATNLAYMNDAREVVNGLDEIKALLMEIQEIEKWLQQHKDLDIEEGTYEKMNPAIILTEDSRKELLDSSSKYTLSFCKKRNLLSQWIAYARESGVCMEMAFELDQDTGFRFYGADPEEKKRNIEKSIRPKEILYYTHSSRMPAQEKEKTRDEILKRIFSDQLTPEILKSKWNEVSVYVKQYDFYQEQEYRIAFETEGWEPFRIGYRADKHILKPYLDVECEDGWPVTMVMIGPRFNQQIVFDSVKFFLNHENIKSSALITVEQWRNQLQEYFNEAANECDVLDSEDNKKRLNDWLSKLDASNIREGGARAEIQKRVISLLGENRKYFDTHYLTISGVILQKSDIPYIY